MKKFTSKMNMLLLSVLLISVSTNMTAQSGLTIETSPGYSTFSFTDSQGNSLNSEYSGVFTGGYAVGYRYINVSGLLLKGSIGMRQSGASLIYDDTNYLWDMQYAEAKIGAGYLYYLGRFNPYMTVSGYYGHLLSANQTLNNHNYDILSSEAINGMDYGVYINPGVDIELSEMVSVFSEFNYMMGLANLETGDSGQESYNRAFGFTFGMAISLSK